MDSLPNACWVVILSHMAVQDVLALGLACKATWQATQDPLMWQELARGKWGSAVPATVRDNDWKRWSCHRLSTRSIRPSPLKLLQESYPDPWQHIVACVLCSRTSGSEIITNTIAQFFTLYPTPSAVLAEARGVLEQVLHPLGLQPVRARAVQEISCAFLEKDWHNPGEFWGCGKFATDSWRIFCRGDLSGKGVEDSNLRAYVSWAKSSAAGKSHAKQASATKRAQRQQNNQAAQQRSGSTKRARLQDISHSAGSRMMTRASTIKMTTASSQADGVRGNGNRAAKSVPQPVAAAHARRSQRSKAGTAGR